MAASNAVPISVITGTAISAIIGGLYASGMSAFFAADTGLGAVHFGLTCAPGGSTGLRLFVVGLDPAQRARARSIS